MNVRLVNLFRWAGLSDIAAFTLSTLLTEDKPLSLDELSQRMGYAKSHILYAINLLEKMILVEKIRGKRRKILIKANKGVIKKIIKEHLLRLKYILNEILSDIKDREKRRDFIHEIRSIESEISHLISKLEEINI